MDILFILYAGLIPAVPLIGMNIFKRRKDDLRRGICLFLFVGQILLSSLYAVVYFTR